MQTDVRYKCMCTCSSVSALVVGCVALLLLAFPITDIALGSVYLHECPVAPLLPVYLVVFGVFLLLLLALCVLPHFYPPAFEKWIWSLSILGVILFIFAWFFYGSYLIYSVYPPNYIKRTTNPGNSTDGNVTPATPDYTKNPSSFTPVTPNDTKTTIDPGSSNSSIFTRKNLDNKPNSTVDQSQNQNQSLPVSDQTGMIANNNQTLLKLIQTLSLSTSNTQTNREPLNAPQIVEMKAAAAYCDQTLYLFAFWTTTLIYVGIAVSCSTSSWSVIN